MCIRDRGDTASTLHRYPDGGAFRLRGALAERCKVTPDQVILGNGSDELLGLLARTFLSPGDEAVMAEHTFVTVSYTHLRAHETVLDLVCRLLLEKQKQTNTH